MKKLLRSKSFLTMVSILSILFGFSILCAGALSMLHSLGFVSFSSLNAEETNATVQGDADFPVYTKVPEKAEAAIGTDADLLGAIAGAPFTDMYYLRLEVLSVENDSKYKEGIYDIWRCGDKYRMHRYDLENGEVEASAICDGTRVQLTDFENATIRYEEYTDDYLLEQVTPLPYFEELFQTMNRVTSWVEEEEYLCFSLAHMVLPIEDSVGISKQTGLISYYYRTQNGKILFSVEVKDIDTESVGEALSYLFHFN